MKTKLLFFIASFAVCGCAPTAKDIGESYVSPLRFKDYSCEDLKNEARHIRQENVVVAEQINKSAAEFNQAVSAGVILSPFTFGLSGLAASYKTKDMHKDAGNIAALSTMKGNYSAIREAAQRAGCPQIPELPELKEKELGVKAKNPIPPENS